MSDTPLGRLDPERLRDERKQVDLGPEDTGFDQATQVTAEDPEGKPDLAEPTAGVLPPAR